MRIPMLPPDLSDLLRAITPEQLAVALSHENQVSPLASDRYLHWDELRHRLPPAGLTHEQWWLRLKLARQGQYKRLPLVDKAGAAFVVGLPEPMQSALHHLDMNAGGQIASNEPLHPQYLMYALMQEAITSSQLEGASTTRQVAEKMLQEKRPPRDASERMIYNNYRVMEKVRDLRDEPFSVSLILELHRIVTEGTLMHADDAGRLRQSDDVAVWDERSNTLLHQPPHWRELPERLERLCAFANQPEASSPYLHPVVRAIVLHFMVGYDHPFVDGNGRTARALFYWAMVRSRYWLIEYLSISSFLKEAPSQYGLAYLHTETDGNDVTYFALHQLAVIRKAMDALRANLDHASQAVRQTEQLLAGSPALRCRLNHRQIDLLTGALRNPQEEYRIDTYQQRFNVVYQTARSDLLALEQLGLLYRSKISKAYLFTPVPDLQQRLEWLGKQSEQ